MQHKKGGDIVSRRRGGKERYHLGRGVSWGLFEGNLAPKGGGEKSCFPAVGSLINEKRAHKNPQNFPRKNLAFLESCTKGGCSRKGNRALWEDPNREKKLSRFLLGGGGGGLYWSIRFMGGGEKSFNCSWKGGGKKKGALTKKGVSHFYRAIGSEAVKGRFT